MKKMLLLAAGLLLQACSKSAEPGPNVALTDDGGCVENSTRSIGFHEVGATETQLANQLFAANGITSGNFRYWQYLRDTLQRQYPPYARVGVQVVKLQEYTNGLIVFTSGQNYIFHDGLLHYRAGEPTAGTTLSPVPRLRPGQARSVFLQAAEEFDHNGATWRPRCLDAELGYYNLNAGRSAGPELLVRAWQVTPQGQQYPVACLQDQTGELIYYDNGLRTFTK